MASLPPPESRPTRFAKPRGEPNFLAGVLEHMLADERLLVAFSLSAGLDPAVVAQARDMLGGHRDRDLP